MKVKYFIRGLGIGILFTALLLLVASKKQPVTMSDEDVVTRAKELGMLTADEVEDAKMDDSLDKIKDSIATTEATETQEAEATKEAETSEEPSSSPSPAASKEASVSTEPSADAEESEEPETTKESGVSVTIESGMVSSSIATYFYQKGIVGSATDFNDYIIEQDIAEKIRAGEYTIPKNSSYEDIIDIIT